MRRPFMRRQLATFLSYFLVVSSLTLGVPAVVLAVDAVDLPSAIENAKTPADHEAIAAYYDAEAKAAQAMVEHHRAMAGAYAKNQKPAGSKGVRSSVYRTMPRHCDDLIKSYKSAAHEYEAMAAAHRKAASEIK
jgi:hypothetical protein